ncbi:C-type lectin domain family 4 member E-like [Archocentrus centrarchus]|uniref:C-type lectin domain family 4 member E-like n=1 Tax=Archocentrus centrarchus TaxID=63155 RepID=UPI0011E9B5AD|nr:C-type lectin domain family 4 member E-like [Archocentrus centrarchus]
MPEAEVLYSDVKFKKGKGAVKEAVSSSADATYSEVKISKTQRSTAEQPESVSSSADATYSEVRISQTQRSTAEQPEVPPQAVVSKRSKVTSERVALLVLSVLLAAALSALCVITFDKMKMKNELKNLEDQRMTCENNLTETLSKVKACSTVQPICPTPEVKNESCYTCKAGWEHHGGKCYHFSISKSSWNRSRAYCRAEGGDLVKIDSREEQSFLDGKLRDLMNKDEDKFWIGLTDSAAEGRWMWVDNTSLTESLKFWSNNEPDNWNGTKGEHPDGEDCARMGEKGGAKDLNLWFDAFCSKLHKSICEKAEVTGHLKCFSNSVQPVEH